MTKLNELQATMQDSYKDGDFDGCLTIAKQILTTDPKNVAALQYAARIHSNRKDADLAKPCWNTLTQIAPDLPEPYLQSARIARNEKDWETCVDYIETYLRLNPDHPEAVNIRVQCYLELKDAVKIGPAFSALCRINPRGLATLARRAVQVGLGREVAAPLREHADAGDEDSINLCNTLWRSERDAAIGYEIQKNPFSAAECYRVMRIYKPDENYAATGLARLRKPFIQRARLAYRDGDYERAVEHAITCLEIEPLEADPYILAGRASMQLGNFDASFDFLKTGADLLWEHSWLLINYARAAIKLGKSELAYTAYATVLKRDDDMALKHADECNIQMERLPKVINQEIRDLLKKDQFLDAYGKCDVIQDLGMENEETQSLFDNVRNLGQRKLRDLFEAKDPETLTHAKALVKLDPKAQYAYRVAGRLLLNDRADAEALYYWAQLVKMDSTNAEFLLNTARCYQRLGNKTDAHAAATALLEKDPKHSEGRLILEQTS